jgi:hypothetical protein
MFDWFLSENDAIGLLKKDHDTVKELFDQFEKAESTPAKKKLIEQALMELKVHATIEEELFYPTIRKHVGGELMNEADEEHHVAKVLIAEIEQMNGRDDHRDAKFTVLAENVRHHIKEEENELMPKARGMKIDFEELGHAILKRKKELLARGVPRAAEEVMVANNPKSDSPAQAAKKKPARAAHNGNGHASATKRARTGTKK